MKKNVYVTVAGICGTAALVLLVLSMMTEGTGFLTPALACVAAGEVFSILAMKCREKNDAD